MTLARAQIGGLARAEANHRIRLAKLARATEAANGEKWRDDAACRDVKDPEIFFSINPNSADTAKAVALCGTCPVRKPCGAWADEAHAMGVWGGRWRRVRS